MENFIPPKKILGTIYVTPKGCADKYYIGEANLTIEKIGDNYILNIWANSFHYEIHNGQKTLVGDVGFEIIQPIIEPLKKDRITQIDFPNDRKKVESNWEELYYGHFYHFGHLKIIDWQIRLKFIQNEEIYAIEMKGYVTDDLQKKSENHFVESKFKTKLDAKINSRFNWNYSLNNPNAINKD